ncbi:RidA family protein [Halorubrum sp. BOL3-1]|uniref:RidA family protein n=1 Tax=Halorubrum sp. BOL3-1 TaxID=2497325 RepID=UPI001004FCDF|nr:RidA family protein [Halorubrum sp. BOL3-1]QAU14255.1 RidA family protein [Halorubrum sp. BOL3-1]
MSQTTREIRAETSDETTADLGSRPSRESKRQRAGNESFGARTGESDLVFFQGALPDVNGDVRSDEPVETQVSMCLDRLEPMLENRGATLGDLVKVEVRLTDLDALETVDAVYEERFEDVEFPPRSVVGVCALSGGAAVRIDAVAAEE